MLSKNASKSAVVRTINGFMSPVGSGMLGSGPSHSVPEPETYSTPWSVVGVITDSGPYGEANYNNSNYFVWVQSNASTFNASAGADTLPISLFNASAGADFRGTSVNPVLTAFNPAEAIKQTHTLAVGTMVTLVPVYMDVPQPDANGNPNGAAELVRWSIAGVSTGPQPFVVAAYGPAVSGTVLPYCICNAPGSTANVSVGVNTTHSIGDVINASSISSVTNPGSPLLDNMNKSIGWFEGNYGPTFVTACRPNGGGINGSAGVLCTLTYDVYNEDNTVKLSSNLSRLEPQQFGMTITAANGSNACLCRYTNAGILQLVRPFETTGSTLCNTSGGSMSSPDIMGGL
jgi:hypothetical protein